MKINLKTVKLPGVLILGMISLMVASSSLMAADNKTIHGSVCQASNGSQEKDIDKLAKGAYNNASENRWIVCPLTRDRVTDDIEPNAIRVYVTKISQCFGGLNDQYGEQIYQTTSTGSGWLDLTPPNGGTSVNVAMGSYYVYCKVPPGGYITTILLSEVTPTD